MKKKENLVARRKGEKERDPLFDFASHTQFSLARFPLNPLIPQGVKTKKPNCYRLCTPRVKMEKRPRTNDTPCTSIAPRDTYKLCDNSSFVF